MEIENFLRTLKEDDFGMGDSFRLGNFEFEVIGTRGPNRVDEDGPIVREVETRRSFAMRMRDHHADDGWGRLERAALYRLVTGSAVRRGLVGERFSPRRRSSDRAIGGGLRGGRTVFCSRDEGGTWRLRVRPRRYYLEIVAAWEGGFLRGYENAGVDEER